MTIEDMAKAHLNSVQKAIVDLEKQKENVSNEIASLQKYLQEGVAELNKENTSAVEVVKDESK